LSRRGSCSTWALLQQLILSLELRHTPFELGNARLRSLELHRLRDCGLAPLFQECEWQEEVKNKPRRVDDILSAIRQFYM
jgi:hypothetical protein